MRLLCLVQRLSAALLLLLLVLLSGPTLFSVVTDTVSLVHPSCLRLPTHKAPLSGGGFEVAYGPLAEWARREHGLDPPVCTPMECEISDPQSARTSPRLPPDDACTAEPRRGWRGAQPRVGCGSGWRPRLRPKDVLVFVALREGATLTSVLAEQAGTAGRGCGDALTCLAGVWWGAPSLAAVRVRLFEDCLVGASPGPGGGSCAAVESGSVREVAGMAARGWDVRHTWHPALEDRVREDLETYKTAWMLAEVAAEPALFYVVRQAGWGVGRVRRRAQRCCGFAIGSHRARLRAPARA